MHDPVKTIALAGLLIVTQAAQAALSPEGQREVQALLDFVASSHCTFIRNGSEYTAADARKHMQRKLDYLSRRDMIDTTEDFIERAASESSFSGKPYKVRCDGREQLSGDWLRDELQVLRQVAH